MKKSVLNFKWFIGAALILLLASCNQTQTASTAENDGSTFKGDVQLDVRDSKADWAPYIRKKAPEGAPNILFIL